MHQIFEDRRPYLLAIADRILPPKLRAKAGGSDLVQDTLIAAWLSSPVQKMDSSDQFNWLREILQNRLYDLVRRYKTAKRSIGLELSLQGDNLYFEESIAESNSIRREGYQLLYKAIGRLSEEEQIILALRVFEERKWSEVGLELRKSEEAVRKQYERILKKLEGYLVELRENCP